MDFFVGGVVGLADLAVAAGVAEKQGDDASEPAPAHRLVAQALQVGILAVVQHAGPVEALEGHVAGFDTELLAQAGNQALGENVLALVITLVGLGADAMNNGDCEFYSGHPWSCLDYCLIGEGGYSACRRSPRRPLSTSSRNSSPRRWLSAMACCQ